MIQQHFTATGIVFNKKREVLLIKHKKLGVWLPPGGHVEENELPDDAVLREILEETGIKATLLPNLKGLKARGCRELNTPFTILLEDIEGNGQHNHIDMIYLCSSQDDLLVPDDQEVSDIGWFSYEQLPGLDTFENVVETVSRAMKSMIT